VKALLPKRKSCTRLFRRPGYFHHHSWLKENYGCEVIAVIGDVGQQEDLEAARKKALATGASSAHVEDLREEFVRDYIWPTLRAGAIYEHTYLLGTSMARPVIAKRQAEIALKLGADGSLTAAPARAMTRCDSNWRTKPSRQTCKLLHRGENGILIRAKTPSPTRRSTMFRRAEQEEHLQPRPQHLAPQPRRRRARGSCKRAERSDVAVGRFSGESSGQSRRGRNRI